MATTIRVSEEFREFIKAHKRADETMEDTLRRLIGGPHPESVAGFLSDETAEAIRERAETGSERDAASLREVVDRMDDS